MPDKRIDFDSCFTLSNLMRAADKCYSGVRWKHQAQKFMDNYLTNCSRLLAEIRDGSYKPEHVDPFTISERGKTRVVKPVKFKDRVAQRCFCEHVLIEAIDRYVLDDCSAVLPYRGLDYGFRRVKEYVENAPLDAWFVQYDFSSYFQNLDKNYVYHMIKQALVKDKRLLRFCKAILDEESGGLELGSHVSQLLATAYPTPIDKKLSSLDGIIGYHRYMDDGIAFSDSKETAYKFIETLQSLANTYHLVINPKKLIVNRITHPFVFCKMRFTKQKDGSVRMNVRKQQTRHSIRHIKNVRKRAKTYDCIDIEPVKASFNGYLNRGDANLDWLLERAFE